jgi:hypothetical protein
MAGKLSPAPAIFHRDSMSGLKLVWIGCPERRKSREHVGRHRHFAIPAAIFPRLPIR